MKLVTNVGTLKRLVNHSLLFRKFSWKYTLLFIFGIYVHAHPGEPKRSTTTGAHTSCVCIVIILFFNLLSCSTLIFSIIWAAFGSLDPSIKNPSHIFHELLCLPLLSDGHWEVHCIVLNYIQISSTDNIIQHSYWFTFGYCENRIHSPLDKGRNIIIFWLE